ncbi:MAG: type I-MYXAN CRISPR-associated protein Cas6/Cmx6 [Bdellovibrionales bacterium]
MKTVELSFPVLGESLPTDQGYSLYSCLSKLIPKLHDNMCKIMVRPIAGQYLGEGQIRLDRKRSRLRIRLPTEEILTFLTLAGKPLVVDVHKIRLGVPQIQTLIPAPSLFSRIVMIKSSSPRKDPTDKHSREKSLTKRYLLPEAFLEACRQKLDEIGVGGQIHFPLIQNGEHEGKPRRQVMRIKGKQVVGFSVLVNGLTDEESLILQENGIGGRRKMGCGWFGATKMEGKDHGV